MDWKLASVTSTALLQALGDATNQDAWRALDERYRPVVRALALRCGLQASDADDVAQQTLTEFFRGLAAKRYERGRGRLRSWLVGIAHNLIRAHHRGPPVRHGGTDTLDQADLSEIGALWTQEQNRLIAAEAIRQLRASPRLAPRTLQAFELVVLSGLTPEAAAAQCGMSIDEVYVAKSRVSKTLREIIDEITQAFEADA